MIQNAPWKANGRESIPTMSFFWGFIFFSTSGVGAKGEIRCGVGNLSDECRSRDLVKLSVLRDLCACACVYVFALIFDGINGAVQSESDGPWSSASIAHVHEIINMITHSHEQVKEQFTPHLHFHLHGATTLEGLPASDD